MINKIKQFCICISVFLLLSSSVNAQQLSVKENQLDIGTIESALKIVYEFTIYNRTDKLNYILRCNAPKNCSIQIENKKLLPGDSTSLIVYYEVLKIGAFEEELLLYSGNNLEPLKLSISGKIKNVAVDELQACHPSAINRKQINLPMPDKVYKIDCYVYDEKSKEPINNATAIINLNTNSLNETSNSNGNFSFDATQSIARITINKNAYLPKSISINTSKVNSIIEIPLEKIEEQKEIPAIVNFPTIKNDTINETNIENTNQLSRKEYLPNQIIFLIDKSASMKEPYKLPELKRAINCMLGQLRNIDYISVIYYSTEAHILFENIVSTDIETIQKSIDTLKAKGQTSGGKGISLAYTLAKEHFINKANNEIILATDGAFRLKDSDKKVIDDGIKNGIKMSILAFGNESKDLWQLYKLSLESNGSYLHVKGQKNVCDVLIEEIKNNSRIKK